MESRAFIRIATALIGRIQNSDAGRGNHNAEENAAEHSAIQKELNQLYSGMHNPTLPSAGKLAELAAMSGYQMSPLVLQRLQQAEGMWS